MKADDRGADTLPVALVTTLLLTILIVGIAVAGIKNVSPDIESWSVEAQANTLSADCQALLTSAPRYLDDPQAATGATLTFDLLLPSSTEYFGLGSDGIIYYSVAGRNKAIVVDPGISFRTRGDGDLDSVLTSEDVVLRSGRYRLQIEYTCDALGNRYLLVNSSG